jgi:hypothetical protein
MLAVTNQKGLIPWGEAGRLQDESTASIDDMDVEPPYSIASFGESHHLRASMQYDSPSSLAGLCMWFTALRSFTNFMVSMLRW